MAKRNLGTSRADAPVTIALGPGFEAGRDVDFVIETNRGPSLGRVIESGSAETDTGVPGEVGGAGAERVVRASASGEFRARARIGDLVRAGDAVAEVGGAPVVARVSGLLRGLAADGLAVKRGEKVGDVDPRGAAVDAKAVSDKARAVGRAVLAALRARGVAPDV
jgi:xanthine dehydrogenase accessory factor